VCDIGGGSTELITDRKAVSVDVGSVRVRERYLDGDPPTPDSVERARTAIRGSLADITSMDGELVGVAGTITTIAALDAGLRVYDSEVVHGYRLAASRVAHWAERLNTLTTVQIRVLGPVDPGRADVIGAGALVLDAVVERLGCDELCVSEHDILDGLSHDLLR
jgi:exopolyphosphatase/guanosine-5'-triphosphate,3'-diphosphate pyrophosphatase